MKTTLLALAATSLLALGAPALAQEAGAPGASGVTGSMSGSNNGTGFGWNAPLSDRINPGPGPVGRYGYDNGYGYMTEGRASAPDFDNEDGPSYGRRGYDRGDQFDGPRAGYDGPR